MTQLFSRELIQAVSDWQRDGTEKQKRQRGDALKTLCANLPTHFRECELVCFRQIAIEVKEVWALIGEDRLPGRISSWTVDVEVAKQFKGGVPPKDGGFQGVILVLHPPADRVIVNLRALYRDDRFLAAIERYKSEIDWFTQGAGKWSDTQSEVVLEISTVHQENVYSLGGWSSPGDKLVDQAAMELLGHAPRTPEERQALLLELSDVANAPMWLMPEATKRVLARVKPQAKRLKAIKDQREGLQELSPDLPQEP